MKLFPPHLVLLAPWILAAGVAFAGLQITPENLESVPKLNRNSNVMAQCLNADPGGTTSLRFASNKPLDENKFTLAGATPRVNNNRIAPPTEPRVRQRDRDLGQTFLTGARGFRVEAVWLRLGFSDKFALSGAAGAEVALQFFEVQGEPRINNSGTPGKLGTFDRKNAPELDDYLEGETYRPLRLIRGGQLPAKVSPGMVLKFTLTGDDQLKLEPHKCYAFLLLFTERGTDRALALANSFFGSYKPDPARPPVGHAIRREGGSGAAVSPEFNPDLPDNLEARTAQQPGTLGFPDVCTWRDLWFTITAVPEPPGGR